MSNEAAKSVKLLPIFDGEEANFQNWWDDFEAFAVVHKFSIALEIDADLPATAATPPSTVPADLLKEQKALHRNAVAMAQLQQALKTDTDRAFIYTAKLNADWPKGLASDVVTLIMAKYRPQDATSLMSLRAELNNLTLGDDEDPRNLFGRIAKIKNRYNVPGTTVIPDEQLMATVMAIAPKEYQMLLTTVRLTNPALTMAIIERAMNNHFTGCVKLRIKPGSKNKKGDYTLSAFGGTCFDCGQKGHKSGNEECPKKGQGNKRRGFGKAKGKKNKCDTCGKVHAGPCWEDTKNAHLRPKNWKSSKGITEVNAAAVSSKNGDIDILLCGFCGLDSESEDDVLMEFNNEAQEDSGDTELGFTGLTFPTVQALLNDPNVFIADTGSTCHATRSDVGMTNRRNAAERDAITMGNGAKEKMAFTGELPGIICNKQGQEIAAAIMQDVAYLPSIKFNLFSCSKLQQDGWTMIGTKDEIKMTKGQAQIVFDIVIPTAKGAIYAVYFKRNQQSGEVANMAAQDSGQEPYKKPHMTIMQAHSRFGHANEEATRKTAKHLGIKISQGKMGVCEGCSVAKAKQKNVTKQNETHVKSQIFGERIFLDISTIRAQESTPMTKPNWRIMVDEATNFKISDFYDTKAGMVEPTCELLNKWKQNNKIVKFIRMDNAGENLKLRARAESVDWKLNVTFEMTARDTPQQNHLAELGFATLINKARALMAAAHVPDSIRYKLWREAITTATLLDGLQLVTVKSVTKTRYEHAFGVNPKFTHHLRTWGEAGTVKTKLIETPKLADRGTACMFIGYAMHHDGDCYKMWNPVTSRVHTTRDIIWLHRMFYVKDIGQNIATVPEYVSAEDVGEGIDISPDSPSEEGEDPEDTADDETVPTENLAGDRPFSTTRSGRKITPPQRLIEEIGAVAAQGYQQAQSFEMKLTNAELNYYDIMTQLQGFQGELGCVMSEVEEMTLVGSALGGGFDNTTELHVMKYDEVMAGPDKSEWEASIIEEHDRMLKRKVWKAVPIDKVPKNERIITSTWAMKKKSSGTRRARVNARGFEQVPGVHYDPKTIAAPVINDITIRVIIVLMLMAVFFGELLDVKGAFLIGDFSPNEKPIYMKVPQGFKDFYPPGWVLLLLKTIYGLKQAAYAFWRALLKAFREMQFQRSKADPCLYYAWTKHGLVTWITWVDDCLVTGSKEGIAIAKAKLMKKFDCDEIGNMDEYVGCKVDRDFAEGSIKFTQPVMLQSFKDEFDIPLTRPPNTPGVPGDHLTKGDEGTLMDEKMQTTYRSGVGKLLHMMRWSRPEILNSVRELSKYMTGATLAHMKAMIRVMQYCHSTPERGLLLKPTRKWNGDPKFEFIISGYSDSDYAKNTDSRRSVSGTVVFLEDAPVSSRSSTQKSVTLSVTEAELAAAVQCAQDMLFVMRLMESIGLKVKKPMILKLDNKGAHDLTHNWTIGGRTRHVDVRMHFLRELKEEGLIMTEWIAGENNPSDIFTKNLQGPPFEKHASKLVGQDQYMTTNTNNSGSE